MKGKRKCELNAVKDLGIQKQPLRLAHSFQNLHKIMRLRKSQAERRDILDAIALHCS